MRKFKKFLIDVATFALYLVVLYGIGLVAYFLVVYLRSPNFPMGN